MKTRNLIIICVLIILFALILSSGIINNSVNKDKNEYNYTDDLNLTDYNTTYNISDDISNDIQEDYNQNTHREHYTREKGYHITEDEYYDMYDYGDNYEIDNYLESGGELYYEY